MNKLTVLSLLHAGVGLILGSVFSFGQELIENGSFEQGPPISTSLKYRTLRTGSRELYNWVVTRGTIDVVDEALAPASEGKRWVDLNGTPGIGGISQRFDTIPGLPYVVTFDRSRNPVNGMPISKIEVSAAGQAQVFSFDPTGISWEDLKWLPAEWTFTARESRTLLQFRSLDTQAPENGPALDNVSVVCGIATPQAEIVHTSPNCIEVVITSNVAIRGGELAVAYDPSILTPTKVKPGPDFPQDGQIQIDLEPPINCSPKNEVIAGLTIDWLNPAGEGALTPPGINALLKVCFNLADEAELGSCTSLRFVECLSVPAAPARNIVTDENNHSLELSTQDGQLCIMEELSFRRGDSDGSGKLDITDPIVILRCLFFGDACPSCSDAADSNDDGDLNIADPVYLLNWLFLDGPEPRPPYPDCGKDPTKDGLDDCESFAICQNP